MDPLSKNTRTDALARRAARVTEEANQQQQPTETQPRQQSRPSRIAREGGWRDQDRANEMSVACARCRASVFLCAAVLKRSDPAVPTPQVF